MSGKRIHPLRLDVPRGNKCVEWTGSRTTAGYGHRWKNGGFSYIHREAWELANGTVPEGQHVLHSCDNPACYNVDHLFLGTHADNMKDMAIKERGRRKLRAVDVRYIRNEVAAGAQQLALANKFGVTPTAICSIVKRRNHKYA